MSEVGSQTSDLRPLISDLRLPISGLRSLLHALHFPLLRFVDTNALDLGRFVVAPYVKIRAYFILNHRHNRFEYLVITGTPAKIPRHPFFYLIFRRLGVGIQKRFRRHDLTWSADPALKPAIFKKSLLQGMEAAVFGKSFDRRDLLSLTTYRKSQAGAYQSATDDHAAGATNADAASLLGSG